MKKFLGLIIKIIPIITLWQGITSGGARLGPFMDTLKVALTQYEIGHITKLVYENLNQNNKLVPSAEFADFIRENYHNQYSVLAREIKGDKHHDHALDIWGSPFQLGHDQLKFKVKIASGGPDLKINTKDDVVMDFGFDDGTQRRPASVPHPRVEERVELAVEEPESEHVQDEDENHEDEYREPATDAAPPEEEPLQEEVMHEPAENEQAIGPAETESQYYEN